MRNAELDRKVKAYILENIDVDSPGVNESTDAEKIAALAETFQAEYGWRVAQVGELQAMIDWLQGLPPVIHIDFYNHRILEIAKEWGSLPDDPTEAQEYKILDNWWNLIANKTLQLFRKYKV